MSTMPPVSTPLLAQIRRVRGLWALVAIAFLLKLVSSSLCISDGLNSGAKLDGDQRIYASQIVGEPTPVVSVDSGDCVLGEGSSCHCACPHAVPMPSVLATVGGAQIVQNVFPQPALANLATPVASFLRPPIA